MSNLIPFRAGLDFPKGDEADKIIDQNFAALAKQGDKVGLYLKGSESTTTVQTFSTSSFADANNLKLSVNLNGGLIVVCASISVRVSGNVGTFQLLAGTDVLDTAAAGAAGADVSSRLTLFWCGPKPAGQTNFKIQGKASSGGVVTSEYSKSQIYVLEYTKG